MFLRTDNELKDALAKLAEIEGTSQREVIRRAVLEQLRLHENEDKTADASARLIVRWRTVIDRLGRA